MIEPTSINSTCSHEPRDILVVHGGDSRLEQSHINNLAGFVIGLKSTSSCKVGILASELDRKTIQNISSTFDYYVEFSKERNRPIEASTHDDLFYQRYYSHFNANHLQILFDGSLLGETSSRGFQSTLYHYLKYLHEYLDSTRPTAVVCSLMTAYNRWWIPVVHEVCRKLEIQTIHIQRFPWNRLFLSTELDLETYMLEDTYQHYLNKGLTESERTQLQKTIESAKQFLISRQHQINLLK